MSVLAACMDRSMCRGKMGQLLMVGWLLVGAGVTLKAQEQAPAPPAFDFLRLAHPEVAAQLKLTDPQRAQVTRILADRANRLAQSPPDERPPIITAANRQLSKLLTDDQRKLLATLPAQQSLYFQFIDQTWPEVLGWFAEQSDLSLVMNNPPPGTFTYRDSRGYSPRDAIDLLNSVLLTKGFSLVRRERTLILVDLKTDLTTELIPVVPLDKIEQRGRFELVTILFPLGKRPATTVDTAVKQLLPPFGRAITLAPTQQIRITDMAAKMPAYSLLISSVPEPKSPAPPVKPPPAPKPVLVAYPYKGIDAQVAVQMLQTLISGATYAADQRTRQISAYGTPAQQTAVKAVLDQLTKEPPVETASRLEAYRLRTAPSDSLAAQLKLVAPDAQISIDNGDLRLLAFASPDGQKAIQETLNKLGLHSDQPATEQLKAYDLKGNDTAAVSSALQALVPGISVHVGSRGERILIRATGQQHALILGVIEELTPVNDVAHRRTLRFYPQAMPLPDGLMTALENLVIGASLGWDTTTRRLTAVATAAQHAVIEETLRDFDATGERLQKPSVKIYPVSELQRSRFSRLQADLLDAFPGMRVIDAGTAGELVILATADQHQRFQQLLETLVTEVAIEPRRVLQSYPLPGKATPVIRSLLVETVPSAQLTWDDTQNRLVVLGTEQEQAHVKQLLSQIGEHLTPPAAAHLKIFPVGPDQRRRFLELQSALSDRFSDMRVVDTANARELAIWATPAQHRQLAQLLETLGDPALAPDRTVVVGYPITLGLASEARELLGELYPALKIIADDAHQRLLVWATDEEHLPLKAFVEQWNRSGTAPQTRKLVPYNLPVGEAEPLLPVLTELVPEMQLSVVGNRIVAWGGQRDHDRLASVVKPFLLDSDSLKRVLRVYPTMPRDPQQILQVFLTLAPAIQYAVDPKTGGLATVATLAEHEILQAALEQIEHLQSQPDADRSLDIYRLGPAPVAETSQMLRDALPGLQIISTGPGQLLIQGTADEHRRARELIDKVRASVPQPDAREVRVHTVARMPAAAMLDLLPSDLIENVSIRRQGQNLVVSGSPRQQVDLAAAIKRIEVQLPAPAADTAPVVQVHTVRNMSAADLVEILPPAIIEGISIRRKDQNLIVSGNARQQANLAAAIERIDAQLPGTEDGAAPELRVYKLKFASASSADRLVESLLPDVTSILDSGSQSVVVTATPSEHQRVTKMIEQLDQPETTEKATRVYTFQHCNPAPAQTVLAGLFPDAVISVDTNVMKLVATATADQHLQIAQVCEQLDQVSEEQQPVSRIYQLKAAVASSLQSAIAALLPKTSLSLDRHSGMLVATATAEEHRQIHDLVEQMQQRGVTDQRVAHTYATGTMSAQVVADAVRATFPEEGQISCHPSSTGRSLVVVATDRNHLLIRKLIAEIGGDEQTSASTLQVYPLDQADGTSVVSVLQTLFRDKQPRAEVRIDPSGSQLLAVATTAQHQRIALALQQLQGSRRTLEVFPLTVVDPFTAQSSIDQLFNGAPENSTPTTDVDAGTQKLFVRGTLQQIQEIRQMLAKMGEPITASGNARGPLRVIPLQGDPLDAVRQIQRLWSELRENKIHIVQPGSTPPNPLPQPKSRRDPVPDMEERPVEPRPVSETTPQAGRIRLTSAPPATPQPAPVEKPPIVVIPGKTGLTIASSDLDALDRFESLLQALLRGRDEAVIGAGNFSIIPLENADATQIKELLKQLWQNIPGALRGGPGALVVAAAERLNSLVVYGSRADRKVAEFLALSLDTADPPSSLGIRAPRIVRIEHADVQEITSILRSVYKSQLSSGGGRKKVSIPEGVSESVASVLAQINAAAAAPLLTLHADQQTNSIIVHAPLELAEEVANFAQTLDEQVKSHSARTVELVPLRGGNARRVRRALNALLD